MIGGQFSVHKGRKPPWLPSKRSRSRIAGRHRKEFSQVRWSRLKTRKQRLTTPECRDNHSRRRSTARSSSINRKGKRRTTWSMRFVIWRVSGRSDIWAHLIRWRRVFWCCCSAGPRGWCSSMPGAVNAMRRVFDSASRRIRTIPMAKRRGQTPRRRWMLPPSKSLPRSAWVGSRRRPRHFPRRK